LSLACWSVCQTAAFPIPVRLDQRQTDDGKHGLLDHFRVISAKLHYTDTGYGHVVQHTNGRAHNNSTTCCTTNPPPTDKNLPHPNILTCRDVGLWHCMCCKFLVQQVVELLWCLSVCGVVQHVRSRCPCNGVWH